METSLIKQQKSSTNTNIQTNGSHRRCRHNHVKVQDTSNTNDDTASAISQNNNEHNEADKIDRLVLPGSKPISERPPNVSGSVKKASLSSSRPQSRRLDSRPGSSRTVFEHIPGTRPASRRRKEKLQQLHVPNGDTISRSSNRTRRPDSSGTQAFIKGQGHVSDSDSDHEESRQYMNGFDTDLTHIDIHDEKAFDTDLEVEDTTTSYDHTGRTSYIDTCKKLGVVPASYFLRHMNDRHLSMKHHGLGPGGMKALAESLSSNTSVLELDLSDNWLGPQGGLALCDMLKENCFITQLNLSDNHLGTDCGPHLAQIMQQNVTLTHIILSGNEFDDHSAPYFADAILNTTKVQYLNLSHNNFGDASGAILGPAIADNTCIKELDLSWNCIRRKGAVAITQGVKNNVFMKKINLSWNGFGLEGAVGIQDALKGNSVLEELDISNNRITTEGAVLIGKGLSLNENLQVLKMGKNPMQSAGCYGICAAILCNPNSVIQQLDFSDILVNKDFEDVFQQVKDLLPSIKIMHGGMMPPQKPKAKVHPMQKLCNYIEKNDLRLIDFFNKCDKDGSMSVTHEEFIEGIEESGLKLSEEEVEILLNELDRDGDGEINYNELVVTHVDFQEKREQINTVLTVMQPRPMTS